ncbi:DMT family transporter [Sulfitobacter sp. F26204]|uniref:DMT family transporter n=1 Tax=Sulfitobacter sp. F26204 TaxID=2996014 RepID=UPI00225DE830|nr:DMT family transporter [Sulfitobacter sp. F26204]MCX7559316.1 DMT family transporter [Sulfitobacter sp. F26204]
MKQTPEITYKSWLMIVTLAFVWGGTFMVTEVALTGMTPFWLAAARIGFAAVVMLVIWAARGLVLFHTPPSGPARVTLVVVSGLSGALPFALLAWGQLHVTSGFAGVSMASTALIILPLAHFLVPGERMTWRRILGFLIGFCGVAILIGGQAFASTGGNLETLGRMACIGAAGCYALSSILMRRLPAVDAIGLSTILLVLGSAFSIPLALILEGPPQMPTPQILLVLVFLGLVPTAAANFLRVLVVRSAGPVFMSLVNYQVPVWSVVLGALILSEPLPPSLLYAMALILAGLALSQYGALRRLFGKRHQGKNA